MMRVGREGKAEMVKEGESKRMKGKGGIEKNKQTDTSKPSQAKPSHSQWEGRRRKTDEDSKAEEMKGKPFYL